MAHLYGQNMFAAAQGPMVAYDITRQQVLMQVIPPVHPSAGHLSEATTKSTFRLRWNNLTEWTEFPNQVINYSNNIPLNDRNAGVMNTSTFQFCWERVADPIAVRGELHIQTFLELYVSSCHNAAAVGRHNAPLPYDRHSAIVQNAQTPNGFPVVGIPDFLMAVGLTWNEPTAIFEIKTPWLVTARQVDDVLEDAINPGIFSGNSD